MALGGLSEEELTRIRRALLATPRAPAQVEDDIRRTLDWFPHAQLTRWFSLGDGGKASDELHVFSLNEAVGARRELLLRGLDAPLNSRSQFLPLMRCPAGLLIFDGASAGLVLRRTKDTRAYARDRMAPLPLAEFDDRLHIPPHHPPAAPPAPQASTEPPPDFFEQLVPIEWLPGKPTVKAVVPFERLQTEPTSQQRRLLDNLAELGARDASLAARIEDALFTYYEAIRGTDYGSAEQDAEREPTLDESNEIWALLSSPELHFDSDDGVGDEPVGFELTWTATFDDEHGVAVRIVNGEVTGVGTYSGCRPLAEVREDAKERQRAMPKLVSFEAHLSPAFSEELHISVSRAPARATVNGQRFMVEQTALNVLVAVMNRVHAWQPFESYLPGADGITLTASLLFDDRTVEIEAWSPTKTRAPRAHAFGVAILEFINRLPIDDSLQRAVDEALEYL